MEQNLQLDQWKDASYTDLVTYIEEKHHTYVKQELPIMKQLIEELVSKYGIEYHELGRVQHLFQLLERDLDTHLRREEKDTFRLIREYDENPMHPKAHLLVRMTQTLEGEHEISLHILAELRKVTNDYELPADADENYHSVYRKFVELEADLREHIYLEDKILFERLIREF